MQHRGEQPDLLAGHPAQPLAVDRDRRQQVLQLPARGQRAQPAADDHVQRGRVQGLQQRTDPLLTRRDDLLPQRVRCPAERGQQVLGQVAGLVTDLPETFAPASTHTTATASTNTRVNRRPRLRRGSLTRASISSRPGTCSSVLARMRLLACETGMDGLLFREVEASTP
jgi:hypothetical protein